MFLGKKGQINPLGFTSVGIWTKLLLRNKCEAKYIFRIIRLFIIGLITFCGNTIESIRYKRLIANHSIKKDPIFIIGHWRTGTTHLHNLMSMDPEFAFSSLFQTIFPKSFISLANFKSVIAESMPETRPIDNMLMNVDLPQEEEFAIARLVPCSFYHSFAFSDNAELFFKKYVLLEDISEKELTELKKAYLFFVKKVSYVSEGKQLILKNPVNTARIKFLLSIFPKAKFVHIYRNPYDILESTKNMRRKLSEHAKVYSGPNQNEITEMVLRQYVEMMQSYFEQKDAIPEGSLAEVRYENLVQQPEKEIEQIYRKLNIVFSDTAGKNIKEYLISQKNYKKNHFDLSVEDREKIRKMWGFAIEKWGYNE